MDLNIKVIYNNFHTTNPMDLGLIFLSWLSGDILIPNSCDIDIFQPVRFARCCTSGFRLSFKNSSNITYIIAIRLYISGASYNVMKVILILLWTIVKIWFNILQNEWVFCGYRVKKIRRVKSDMLFLGGSKILVKYRRSWKYYDPLIIEMALGFVLGPSKYLHILFLTHCTPTNKAVSAASIWRACPELLKGDRVQILALSIFRRDSFCPLTRARYQMGGAQ